LALLLLAPVGWIWGYHSLASLGHLLRAVVLALRTAVFVLVVFALAQLQIVNTGDRLTVLYLLDQSISIPEAQRQAMSEYVNRSIVQHRRAPKRDRAGVIVFAKDSAIEYPPVDENLKLTSNAETSLDGSFTNLAAAMRMAMSTLPSDSNNRRYFFKMLNKLLYLSVHSGTS
jgi:hypothetical protein